MKDSARRRNRFRALKHEVQRLVKKSKASREAASGKANRSTPDTPVT